MLLLAALSAVASESPPGCDSSRCRSTGNDCCPPVCDICNGGLLRANITAGYTANVSYTCQEAQDFARDEGVQKCSEFQACRWLYRVRVWVSLSGRVSAVRAPLAPAPQLEPYNSHNHLALTLTRPPGERRAVRPISRHWRATPTRTLPTPRSSPDCSCASTTA